MPQLPSEPVEFEQAIRAKIRDTFLAVPLIVSMCQLHARERYPDNEKDDIAISTVPDPITALPLTSIIQIGIPSVEELEYVGDHCTQLNLTYPITLDLGVVDAWDDPALEFKNSSDLAMAIYMRARAKFKEDRTFGFVNVVHEYLQQDTAGTSVPDEESGGRLHVADWSLTVKCTAVIA